MDQALLFGIDGIVWNVAPVSRLWLMPSALDVLLRDAETGQKLRQVVVEIKTLCVVKDSRDIARSRAYIELLP